MFGHLKTPRFLVIVVAFSLGCSAPPKQTKPNDGLIGRPPPPSEDPFYFVAMEEAVPVESSGMVEPDPAPDFSAEREIIQRRLAELEERESQIRSEFERLGQERDQLAQASSDLKTSQLALQKERQEIDELRRGLQKLEEKKTSPEKIIPEKAEPRKSTHSEVQCVACVSVCPMIGGQLKCPKEEDLVCGWGSHPDRVTAAKLATAECNGALRLMEGSKVYGEIGGECPRPSCKP